MNFGLSEAGNKVSWTPESPEWAKASSPEKRIFIRVGSHVTPIFLAFEPLIFRAEVTAISPTKGLSLLTLHQRRRYYGIPNFVKKGTKFVAGLPRSARQRRRWALGMKFL